MARHWRTAARVVLRASSNSTSSTTGATFVQGGRAAGAGPPALSSTTAAMTASSAGACQQQQQQPGHHRHARDHQLQQQLQQHLLLASAAAPSLPGVGSSSSPPAAWPRDQQQQQLRGLASTTRSCLAAAAAGGGPPTPAPAATEELPQQILSAAEGPALLYRQGLQTGMYRPDPLQQVTVCKLQAVFDALREAYPAPRKQSGLTMVDSVGAGTKEQSSWFSELSTLIKSGAGLHGSSLPSGASPPAIKGLYMFGGVGCGKTMLMDLLVAAAPREFQVRRVHFHDFMLDIHSRLRTTSGEADPLRHVADDVAAGIKVLCLDELFVTDVADAMILHRLFGRLWEAGLVLVATSNRAPDALYENGLQRQLFLPFIQKLKDSCVIHNMASPVDYRRLAHHTRGIYFLTPDRTALLHTAFLEAGSDSMAAAAAAGGSIGGSSSGAAGGAVGQPGPRSVQVAMGRQLTVPQALGAAALFDFNELCARPLAAADYIALAENFSTLALADVPLFGGANLAAAYRFVTLVDVLYEHRVRLLVSAEGTPFELFERVISPEEAQKSAASTHGLTPRSAAAPTHGGLQQGFSSSSGGGPDSGAGGPDCVVDPSLAFVKDRAISRLTEMQSLEYQLSYAQQHAPQLVLALQEAQDKQRAQQQQGRR